MIKNERLKDYKYSFLNIAGHEKAVHFLKNLALNDRIPAGFLFYGPEGIGKRSVAFSFAAEMLCKDLNLGLEREGNSPSGPCGECPACRGILNGTNSNFIFIEPKDDSIRIEKIHELNSYMSLTPFYDNYRFVIIDNASKMNASAANALLKMLEEPPERSVFILITTSMGSILPTIISRCQVLEFKPLSEDLLAKYACDRFKDVDKRTLDVYSRLSRGSCSTLEKLVTGNYLEYRNDITELFSNGLFYSGSLSYGYIMSEKFNRIMKNSEDDPQGTEKFLFETLLLILRDIFVYFMTKNEKLLYNIDISGKIKEIIKNAGLNGNMIMQMIELTAAYINKINYNLNRTIATDGYFVRLLKDISAK